MTEPHWVLWDSVSVEEFPSLDAAQDDIVAMAMREGAPVARGVVYEEFEDVLRTAAAIVSGDPEPAVYRPGKDEVFFVGGGIQVCLTHPPEDPDTIEDERCRLQIFGPKGAELYDGTANDLMSQLREILPNALREQLREAKRLLDKYEETLEQFNDEDLSTEQVIDNLHLVAYEAQEISINL